MYVLLAGVSHQTAPVEVRERLAISAGGFKRAYARLKSCPDIEGAVILSTCNRTEVYATARDIEPGMQSLRNFLVELSGMESSELDKYIYQPNCHDAILHIFRVAAGLDSMIVGESQIIGQVKEAYQLALEMEVSDPILNVLFQKAIRVGKKVRTQTSLEKLPLSVSYAAVELARQSLGTLAGKTVMVVGAGEMSELTTRHLMTNGVQSVIVSNRSFDKAADMAARFNGKAIRFEELPVELGRADIVISCTAASHYVIHSDNCASVLSARNGRKIILVDIAVPRDIDPALTAIAGVDIYDIDDLQGVVELNEVERQQAIYEAERIISREIIRFNEWLATLYVVPVIADLKALGARIKESELQRAMNRLGNVSPREEKIIASLANSIVNQILHQPIVTLKDMAITNQGHLYAEMVKKLFDLQAEPEDQYAYTNLEIRNQRQ